MKPSNSISTLTSHHQLQHEHRPTSSPVQDRFGSIARAYYKEAYGAILVYDVGRSSSFETVPRWKGEIDDKVSQSFVYTNVFQRYDKHNAPWILKLRILFSSYTEDVYMYMLHEAVWNPLCSTRAIEVWYTYDITHRLRRWPSTKWILDLTAVFLFIFINTARYE